MLYVSSMPYLTVINIGNLTIKDQFMLNYNSEPSIEVTPSGKYIIVWN